MVEDFRLGEWLVRPQRDCIERDEEAVHLKPKAMAVLVCLARAGGKVVTRNELFETVWPGAVVSDPTLTQCIVELRHAFNDSARQPAVIETVPKVGFRLIPAVVPVVQSDPQVNNRDGYALQDDAEKAVGSPARKWPFALVGAVLLLVLTATAYWTYNRNRVSPTPGKDPKSLAVLPFEDLSEDQSQGWFASGLSEELRASLIRLRGLRVAGGNSSSQFGSEPNDLRSVAELLAVDYFLMGSVRQESPRLRVTARLVDAATGFHLWSETFDRPEDDVFAVQAEISESVAVALSIALGVGELGNAPGGTTSFEAFEMALRARERFQVFTPESVMEAIRLLQQALEIDPDYATAWVDMAVYCGLGQLAFSGPPAVDWLERSREALDRARSLSPEMPALLAATMDLHGALGEWGEVERNMIHAGESKVALLPQVHFSYGIFLTKMGRVHDALTHLHHARQLEPLAPWYGSKLGHIYLLNGRIGDALAEHERVWALNRGNRVFQSTDGLLASLGAGDPDGIEKWLTRAIDHSSGHLAEFFEAMKQRLDDSAAAVSWLKGAYIRREFEGADYWISVFAAWFGDTALALDALLRTPDAYAIWAPFMADVRRQPGFRDVVRKLGLPDYWRQYTWADFCEPVGAEDFVCR